MKNIIKTLVILVAIAGFSACDPQEEDRKDLGNVVNASDIKMTVTVPDPQKPNNYHFALTTPECVGMFSCPELGINGKGLEINQYIPWEGSYNMIVSVYNKAGISEPATIPFSVASTDPSICDNEIYKLLTGGCDNPNGKTWRINGDLPGHIGCGPEDANSNTWWNPDPNSLTPALYDDDMTFVLNSSQHFILDNKGASFMNESTAALFPDGDPAASFVTTHYTPATNASWNIEQQNGVNWLVINKGFPAYAVNPNAVVGGKYKIVSLTSTDMHIVYLPGGISWHYYLTSKPR